MTRLKKTRRPIRRRLNKELILKSLNVTDLQRHFSNTNLFKGQTGSYENLPAATVVFDLSGSSLDIRNRGAKKFAADSQYLFRRLTDIIYYNHGIVEKFPGDGISMHFPSIPFDEWNKYSFEKNFDNINFDGINFNEIDLDEDGFYKVNVDEVYPYEENFDGEDFDEGDLDEENFDEENFDEENFDEENFDEENFDEENFDEDWLSKATAIYHACKAIKQMDYFLRKRMKMRRSKYRFTLTYGKDTIVTTFGSSRHKELITIGHSVNVAHKLEKLVKQKGCFLGIDPSCRTFIEFMNIFPCLSSYSLPKELSRNNKPNELWYGVKF